MAETNGTNGFTIKDFLKSIDDRLIRIDTKLDSKADKSFVDNVEVRLRNVEQQGSVLAKEASARVDKLEETQREWPKSRTNELLQDFSNVKKQVNRLWMLVGTLIVALAITIGKTSGLIPWIP